MDGLGDEEWGVPESGTSLPSSHSISHSSSPVTEISASQKNGARDSSPGDVVFISKVPRWGWREDVKDLCVSVPCGAQFEPDDLILFTSVSALSLDDR